MIDYFKNLLGTSKTLMTTDVNENDPTTSWKLPIWLYFLALFLVLTWILTYFKVRIPNPFKKKIVRRRARAFRNYARQSYSRARRRFKRRR